MASIDNSEHGMPKQSGVANLIVKGAIALVTVAFFIGAYLQFQATFWMALTASLSVYIVLLLVHALMRRTEREGDLVYEVNRLEDEVARLKVAPPAAFGTRNERAPAFAPPAAARPPSAPMPSMPPLAKGAPAMPPSAAQPPRIFRSAPAADHIKPEPPLTSLRPGAALTEPMRPDPVLSPPSGSIFGGDAVPPGPSLPDWSAAPGAPAAGPSPMHDYWPARQAKPSLPEGPRVELPPLPPVAADRETDLDAVQGMIRRLADEVNVADESSLDGLPPVRQESVLRASLNALQTTANAMRASKKKDGLPVNPAAPRAGAPLPPPIMPSHTRLASLAEAVAAGRIDAALSPIVGLTDHQVHYYEVVARARDERGTVLSATPRDPQLALAGLLPMLDSARLRQAARVARSFADEGRETCLFAAATAVSLANDSFLDELADAYRDREALAGELVMTFAQADVRTFGGSEWSALTDMRDLGFRFGVEDVTDFDYEFTALCAAGFAFVKLDAATLLAGLAAPNGTMSGEEVCRNLSELGLTLIVDNIGEEAVRAQMLAAGVPLGQGALYGAPLPVPDDDFAAASHAAA
jgi:EAL domain-containing protein (putative c-di-GMP-specific phosphodiesterase class I)